MWLTSYDVWGQGREEEEVGPYARVCLIECRISDAASAGQV